MLLIISRAQASFMNAQQLMLNKNWHEAAQVLVKMSDDNLSEVDQGLKYFALGVASSHLQKWQSAELYFNLSRQKSPRLVSHSYFELAKILINKDEYEKAKEYLEKVSKSPSSRNLQNETYLMLSEIDMKNKKWNSAYKNLSILERRWRGEEDHPLVIWRLIQVELERNRKWKACRWARKLYSKYPSHPIIYDWSIDLPRNKINDKSLGCLASENDIQNRIQRWHWAGESDRATKELQELKERIDEGAKYEIDELMSRHLIQQGFAGEAVERLLPYYEQKHKNYDYLMSLAKAASRGGEYQTAVGAYYKAHKLKTKGRDGRTALFRAAFLSYQFQDYDGATRKFQEFIKLYTKSGLSRDAQWHLAWIRYLKGDYRGALSSLSNILQQKKFIKENGQNFQKKKFDIGWQ